MFTNISVMRSYNGQKNIILDLQFYKSELLHKLAIHVPPVLALCFWSKLKFWPLHWCKISFIMLWVYELASFMKLKYFGFFWQKPHFWGKILQNFDLFFEKNPDYFPRQNHMICVFFISIFKKTGPKSAWEKIAFQVTP